jgi:hypothetical protein
VLLVIVVAIASSVDFALVIGTPPTMLAYSTELLPCPGTYSTANLARSAASYPPFWKSFEEAGLRVGGMLVSQTAHNGTYGAVSAAQICARQSRSKAFSRPYPTPIPRNRLRGLRNPITHAHRVPSAAECLRCLSLKAKQLVKGHKFVVVAPCDGGHRTGGDTRLVEAPCGVGTLGGTAIGVCQL